MPATLGCVIATPTELPLLMGGPSPVLPNGRESILAVFEDVWWHFFPLEKAGWGFYVGRKNTPSQFLFLWKPERGLSLLSLSPWEGTEKLKPTIKLKVDDGEIAVLPFIICLF